MTLTSTRRCGVTLIDVIAALVILAIALPRLVSSFAESAMQSITPSYATAAGFLATERMEQIIAMRFQPNGYSRVTEDNFPTESPVNDYPRYTRMVTVTEVATDLATPQSNSGLKKVVVMVTWNGGSRQVTTTRLFADF